MFALNHVRLVTIVSLGVSAAAMGCTSQVYNESSNAIGAPDAGSGSGSPPCVDLRDPMTSSPSIPRPSGPPSASDFTCYPGVADNQDNVTRQGSDLKTGWFDYAGATGYAVEGQIDANGLVMTVGTPVICISEWARTQGHRWSSTVKTFAEETWKFWDLLGSDIGHVRSSGALTARCKVTEPHPQTGVQSCYVELSAPFGEKFGFLELGWYLNYGHDYINTHLMRSESRTQITANGQGNRVEYRWISQHAAAVSRWWAGAKVTFTYGLFSIEHELDGSIIKKSRRFDASDACIMVAQ